jgi:nucleoside permease NupC
MPLWLYNFASIGIQIGGIGVLAEKGFEKFGIKALIERYVLTATIAGVLFG